LNFLFHRKERRVLYVNDLFFSGHTAIAVLGAIELYRLRPRPLVMAGSALIVLFEVSTVLVLRAHYTMDVFTGAIAAIVAANAAEWICSSPMISKNRQLETAVVSQTTSEVEQK